MPKLPFTATGVKQKQQQLYALDDPALWLQVKAIQGDFSRWLDLNFDMSQEQAAYLLSLPEYQRAIWGAQIGAVVATRGPINMANPPKDYGPAYRTKEVKIKIMGETRYTPPVSGTPKIIGQLTAVIEFTLVPW